MFEWMDGMRRAQAAALGLLGLESEECPYDVLASAPRWKLRVYGRPGSLPPLLIVAAPIKRPYIWDLAPSASAVRLCLNHGTQVYLLEWIPPSFAAGGDGLDEYADAILQGIATVSTQANAVKPFLLGHSLGGTLAAISAAVDPERIGGLVLLGTPLCFQPDISPFCDRIAAMDIATLSEMGVVPGSLLSQISAFASPETFIWSRLMDAVFSLVDPGSLEIHARVERWTLDEAPLPGRLVYQISRWLYREDRFFNERLCVLNRTIGPSCVRVPTLAVVNAADEIAPRASVSPFLDGMPVRDVRLIEYPGETGVSLQHVAILVGRQAHAKIWPEIFSWLQSR